MLAATRLWLERAVIGLQLCPFAAPVYRAGRVRFQVSEARKPEQLLEDLGVELRWLQARDESECETTLLIHPWVLNDFLDFNDFLDAAQRLLAAFGLEGGLQIASFHPRFQFAATQPDEIGNYTNRAPYPTLHLLREDSIARAVDGLEDPDEIYRANIRTLQTLGLAGWEKLWRP
ncbi:MAG: DUF1415 domain-containing protein [Steroidobacterales bacterium]